MLTSSPRRLLVESRSRLLCLLLLFARAFIMSSCLRRRFQRWMTTTTTTIQTTTSAPPARYQNPSPRGVLLRAAKTLFSSSSSLNSPRFEREEEEEDKEDKERLGREQEHVLGSCRAKTVAFTVETEKEALAIFERWLKRDPLRPRKVVDSSS